VSTDVPIRTTTMAARLGLLAFSLVFLTGAVRLAVALTGPLRLLVALLGFAAFIFLCGRALEGIDPRGIRRQGDHFPP
jgi:hypothetical protein